MKDQKNLGLPEHILSLFDAIFMFNLEKASFVGFSFDSYSTDDE
jgi:hypothetical protein